MNKDIQPGKWDTSLYNYKWRNEIESENIKSFVCIYNGPIEFNCYEIDEVRFWDMEEILAHTGKGFLTPNFEHELQLYSKNQGLDPPSAHMDQNFSAS
jgi:hypothetical protein